MILRVSAIMDIPNNTDVSEWLRRGKRFEARVWAVLLVRPRPGRKDFAVYQPLWDVSFYREM